MSSRRPMPSADDSNTARAEFREFLKPGVARLLAAFRLDVVFHRARGDCLYYRDDGGREIEVLDFLGGFGASLFGHNHPDLVAVAKEALRSGLAIHATSGLRP